MFAQQNLHLLALHHAAPMLEGQDPTLPQPGQARDRHHRAARKNRDIRRSDSKSEWEREAALQRGIAPAELVHEGIPGLCRIPVALAAATTAADLAPPIKRVVRYIHSLNTRFRVDMIQERRNREVERLVAKPRKLQTFRLEAASERSASRP